MKYERRLGMGGEHAQGSNRLQFLGENLPLLIAMLRKEPSKERRYNEQQCVRPRELCRSIWVTKEMER